jgi:hypothetical protein
MTPTQEDAELADFILGRSARLVDLDRITAFRLAAEEAGFRAGLEWGESARMDGARMALEAGDRWLQQQYGLSPLCADLDPAEIVKGAE